MQKNLLFFLLILALAGCSGSFKSNFRDFNAYYNTFYNAKKSFAAGLEKSTSQKREYNTLLPIRIYQSPKGAGNQDFQNAIDKGADILRKYRDTKWVDDALLIIGKSYFYKAEYFSADQKFDELFISSDNPVMKQRAVFWKGRVLLELQAYNAGVRYLDEQIAEFEGEWDSNLLIQVQTVLAEHYIKRENWVTALDFLTQSVPGLPKKELKERGYFLIGQIQEILGNPEEAFAAYDRVEDYYVEYDLQFEAKKKKAEVARTLGDSNEAYQVFFSMVRDDKNTEFISELNFELGKTEQDRGNYKEAEKIYLRILKDRISQPEPVTKARVYNGLAEINRYAYNDFQRAAAYYDSAAKINVQAEQLPEDFAASELADSFGEYTRLKDNIHEEDSLLWLGALPQDKFDSVLVELERKKREEIRRMQREEEERKNTLVNVNRSVRGQPNAAEQNGFLNIKNQVVLTDARQQFQALWNGRPLVDNWRVSSILVNNVRDDTTAADRASLGTAEEEEIFVNIDLSRIPFTESDRDSVRNRIAFLNYQLGNLFFLSLNLPDSARHYFHQVLDERPQSEVAPVSLYSLSELNAIDDANTETARRQAQELILTYPRSLYAERLAQKYDLEIPVIEEEEEVSPKERYFSIVEDTSLTDSVKTDSLIHFSLSYSQTDVAPKAYYDAIQLIIRQNRRDSLFDEKINKWEQLQEEWEAETERFSLEKDSVRAMLSDTSVVLASSDSLYYQALIDSSLTPPDFSSYFPYRGAKWDTLRTQIDTFLSLYPSSQYTGRVKKLQAEFEYTEESPSEEEIPKESESSAEYLTCEEAGSEAFVRGGKDVFLNSFAIPENVEEESISFLFFINQRGIIDEFQLASDTENQGLINAFVTAIEQNISFEPVLVEGEATAVKCEVRFDLD